MQTFFSSLQSLESYTQSLVSLSDQDTCSFCCQPGQWVSHGFLYKQLSSSQRDIVGKRILCSNRFGKQGCGRTRSLYLAWIIPQHRYSLNVLLAFIVGLFSGATLTHAFHQAIGHDVFDPRQASRWLAALNKKLGWFRSQLPKNARDSVPMRHYRSPRLARLLPTLQQWLAQLFEPNLVQCHLQRPFL